MKLWKHPLAWLYGGLAEGKNLLYDNSLLPSEKLRIPVLSLGNLTVGGTGKTPFADWCLTELKKQNFHPGLVVKSYRAEAQKPMRVDPGQAFAARLFGDEAVMLARRHPGIPVYSGPDKTQSALALSRAEKIDVLLLDDGFQHRKLHRQQDWVLLDATEPFAHYQVLPLGRAREGLESLSRAHRVILTKTNEASEEHLCVLKKLIPPPLPVHEFEVEAGAPVDFLTGKKLPWEGQGDLLLASGLARPDSFLQLCRRTWPGLVCHEIRFRDHHPYTEEDVEKIRSGAQQLGRGRWLTTEKDAVKLAPLWPKNEVLPILPLVMKPKEEQNLKGIFDGLLD